MVDIIWLTSIYVHWGIVRTLSDNDIEWWRNHIQRYWILWLRFNDIRLHNTSSLLLQTKMNLIHQRNMFEIITWCFSTLVLSWGLALVCVTWARPLKMDLFVQGPQVGLRAQELLEEAYNAYKNHTMALILYQHFPLVYGSQWEYHTENLAVYCFTYFTWYRHLKYVSV